ncbi:MAG: hypothetical protein ACOH10_15310 [Rhodoglobus sp.]
MTTPRKTRSAASKAQEALGLATRKRDRIQVALDKVNDAAAGLQDDLRAATVELNYAAANPALAQDELPTAEDLEESAS